jgi:DNA-directed RNA polymerase specialized sigma24 family protein
MRLRMACAALGLAVVLGLAGIFVAGFPRLDDRGDLWQVLVLITARKAADLRRREARLKRGGGQVRGESGLLGSGDDPDEPGRGIDQVIGPEPTPDFAAQVAERCRRLLDRLPDEALRSLALWKMEVDTNEEAAAKLGCSLATVERKLRLIRHTWERFPDGEDFS